jgi:glyoxylase-like metal-dependent hydrolase (beta-lactamase superfamily II)
MLTNNISVNKLLSMTMHQPKSLVASFFDPDTATFTHVVWDEPGGHAAVIDPVLGFDPASGLTSLAPLQPVLDHLRHHRLTLDWILETHAHADHLSSAPQLQAQAGGRIAIGRGIAGVQATFKQRFHLEADLPTDGRPFDHLFDEGEAFQIGQLQAQAWHVPGHTPADIAYVVGDAVFVGDTLFPPDVGTARCDFPGGDARALYRSARRILSLPPDTRLFMCHDYPTTGRPVEPMNTVAQQRAHNAHVHDGVDEHSFVALRQARDATLAPPRLMIPSIQVNIRAGHWPAPDPADPAGGQYLKQPIRAPRDPHQRKESPQP